MLLKTSKNRDLLYRLPVLAVVVLVLLSCSIPPGRNTTLPESGKVIVSPTETRVPVSPTGTSVTFSTRTAVHTLPPITTLGSSTETASPPPPNPNLLQNPGFEAGFNSWHKDPDPSGSKTEVDTSDAHTGAKSLHIKFDGSADVNYWPISQEVPVEASTTYRVSGYLHVQDINTLNSVQLAVRDARGEDYFKYTAPGLSATRNWTPVSVTFTTGPDTTAVLLMVLRSEMNGKFPISGTAWVDDISLVRLPPLIKPSELTVYVGSAQEVTVSNGTAPFVWSSSDTAVAAVEPEADTTRAQVTTNSAGVTSITAVDANGETGVLKLTGIDQSEITIRADQVIREVPEGMFGSNVTYYNTSQYIPDHPTLGTVLNDRDFIKAVADLRISSLRFPGGTESNYYDFSTGKGYVDGWIGESEQYNVTNGITTGQFIHFLRDTNIPNAMITVNVYKSGKKDWPGNNWISPQVAADWVAYTNRTLEFPVKYWELGNEVTAADEFSWNNDPQVPGLTRDLYLKKIQEWSQAMKAVDRDIKIGAVALTSPEKGGLAEWWTLPIIQYHASQIDFLIIHPYVDVGPFMDDGQFTDHTAQEAYAWMWATDPIRALRNLIKTYAPAHVAKIEIQASEWGVTSGGVLTDDFDTLLNAVLNTDSLWDMIQEGTNGANIWNLCEWPYPTMEAAPGGRRFAQYHMLWMNRNRSGKWLLDRQVTSPTYSAGPFGKYEDMNYVEAVDGVPTLSAYATLSEDRRHLYLIVTNKNAGPQSTNIHLDDFTPNSQASVWQMSSANWGDTGVQPVNSMITDAAATFTYTFPARSVTSFIFDAR